MTIEKILNKLTLRERELIANLIEKDPLTGIYNRRKLYQDLEIFASISDRYKSKLFCDPITSILSMLFITG